MRVALASAPGSDEISQDDLFLATALRAAGAQAAVEFWSDKSVSWESYDRIVLRTTWDYHLHLDRFLRWIGQAAVAAEIVNPPALIEWNAHKAYLLELEARGVPTVPTRLIESLSDLDGFTGNDAGRVVLKPEVGASAHGAAVFEVGDRAALRGHAARLLAGGKALLQPYLDRIESDGELSLVWIDGAVSHCVRKRPRPGDFRVQVEHGGSNERVPIPAEGAALAHACIGALPELPTFARIDVVPDEVGELRVMELELIEPELMFQWAPESAETLARALLRP